jgi:hypothetical protein
VPKGDIRVAATAALFDHLVGAGEQHRRKRIYWLLILKIGRLLASAGRRLAPGTRYLRRCPDSLLKVNLTGQVVAPPNRNTSDKVFAVNPGRI